MTSERKNKICFTLKEKSAGKIFIYSEDGLIEGKGILEFLSRPQKRVILLLLPIALTQSTRISAGWGLPESFYPSRRLG